MNERSENKSGDDPSVDRVVHRLWSESERRVLQAAGLALEAIIALQDDKDGSLISPARNALMRCLENTESNGVFASPKDFRINKLNRRRLETLERRHDHLFDRVEADPSLKFDAAECAALHWAVRVLRQVVR